MRPGSTQLPIYPVKTSQTRERWRKPIIVIVILSLVAAVAMVMALSRIRLRGGREGFTTAAEVQRATVESEIRILEETKLKSDARIKIEADLSNNAAYSGDIESINLKSDKVLLEKNSTATQKVGSARVLPVDRSTSVESPKGSVVHKERKANINLKSNTYQILKSHQASSLNNSTSAIHDIRFQYNANRSSSSSILDLVVPFYIYPKLGAISHRLLDCLYNQKSYMDILKSPASQWYGEVEMFTTLSRNRWRTENPDEAEIFYVPMLFLTLSKYDLSNRCAREVIKNSEDLEVFPVYDTPESEGVSRAFLIQNMTKDQVREQVFSAAVHELHSMPYAKRKSGFDHAHAMTFWGEDWRHWRHKKRPAHPAEKLFKALEQGFAFVATWRTRSRYV